jgi:hypothetical protein
MTYGKRFNQLRRMDRSTGTVSSKGKRAGSVRTIEATHCFAAAITNDFRDDLSHHPRTGHRVPASTVRRWVSDWWQDIAVAESWKSNCSLRGDGDSGVFDLLFRSEQQINRLFCGSRLTENKISGGNSLPGRRLPIGEPFTKK